MFCCCWSSRQLKRRLCAPESLKQQQRGRVRLWFCERTGGGERGLHPVRGPEEEERWGFTL